MITIDEMRELESVALDQGITMQQLMENAGKQVFRAVQKKMDLQGKHVIIFVGSGNNGGDGLAAARYFAKECSVLVLFFGKREKMPEEARKNYAKIKNHVTILPIQSEEELKQFRFQKNAQLVLIDALLGTGVKGKLKPQASLAIDYYNSLEGYKVAVDVPSGMNADTGEVEEKSCNVDLIVTHHDLKPGLEKVKEKTVVVDIGIPRRG